MNEIWQASGTNVLKKAHFINMYLDGRETPMNIFSTSF